MHNPGLMDQRRNGLIVALAVSGLGLLLGDGAAVEVTKEAGLPDGLWTTSAAWADFDGDGFPDLYICQYVN